MNAIFNYLNNGNESSIDGQLYDVEKGFNSFWLHGPINDIYENGVKHDNLPLLYQENSNAIIAVRTYHGMSRQTNIRNVAMQRSVCGTMLCIATMDKLSKLAYQNKNSLYH